MGHKRIDERAKMMQLRDKAMTGQWFNCTHKREK
jgi:hypothetical protein